MKEEEEMMKKKILALTSVAMIAVVSAGGFSFAQNSNERLVNNEPQIQMNRAVRAEDDGKAIKDDRNRPIGARNYYNHCWDNEDMIETMRASGFEDMARWMEEGDYEAMHEYMNNLSKEDYEEMIQLMNQNGYGHMWSRRRSVDDKDMVNMHNSMMGGRRGYGRGHMMGRYQY
ncbi:hypothetical protein Clos_2164 [Alkaliphilus oremlandii OhILAs]|uniref:Uncharacterized protein n=2 Tax=Alkaliphilus oremlandii TaxID=461876 RepID=A8MIR8_ALKOO|nr:hypothetical protein Clos_2164 [Alkaliphilus oremlandii OhILAs]